MRIREYFSEGFILSERFFLIITALNTILQILYIVISIVMLLDITCVHHVRELAASVLRGGAQGKPSGKRETRRTC